MDTLAEVGGPRERRVKTTGTWSRPVRKLSSNFVLLLLARPPALPERSSSPMSLRPPGPLV